MGIVHKKAFGIYHWDTFDNYTILIDEADTQEEAVAKVQKRYGSRLKPDGADRVDIVDRNGNIIQKFQTR